MEASSFASGYSLTTLPLVRAVPANSFSFPDLHLFSRRNIHSLTSIGRRCTTVSSPSSSSSSLPFLRISCGMTREVKENEFAEVLSKSNRPVLVEFVATWCGPCRLIAPAIESLAQSFPVLMHTPSYTPSKELQEEYEDKLTIVKVDHDSNPQLIQDYKVYGLPALILFKNGKEVPESRREGAITKAKLKEYIDGLLESVSVA